MPRHPNHGLFALLALLFVALGLPHHVILCDHGDGGHVELLHAVGACCAEADESPALPRPTDPRAPRLWQGCEHTSFAIDGAPTPPASVPVVPPLAPNAAATFATWAPRTAPMPTRRCPPGRAPPPTPRPIENRPTTRLLL